MYKEKHALETMTDLAVPNRSHIFSSTLILLQLALYRLGLRTMVFADDIVLLGRPPSASPEPAPSDGTLQAAGLVRARMGAPSTPPRSSLGAEPGLGAPVRTEVEAVPICRFPSSGKPTWAPYDFCGNTHAIMAGAKALDRSYAARGVRQTHAWNCVTRTCTPLAYNPGASADRHSPPAGQPAASQTSPLPRDDSWKWGCPVPAPRPSALRMRACLARLWSWACGCLPRCLRRVVKGDDKDPA
jgi:hypothetical protein